MYRICRTLAQEMVRRKEIAPHHVRRFHVLLFSLLVLSSFFPRFRQFRMRIPHILRTGICRRRHRGAARAEEVRQGE